ncbi:SWIM zinc finger family protein [Microcoleus vaginatus]|uniref:SWIM zinc finger family protein n=1 Tax=Microcoleus vaginatus TaxID=119532 RepID=UPI00403F93F3
MPIPKLSETTIEHHTSAQSLKRGEAYYLAGNVIRAVRRGNMVQAVVEGSEVEPYRVTLPFDDAGLASTLFCTCPYDNGGWCKHIVATLLLCLRQPEIIEQGSDTGTIARSPQRCTNPAINTAFSKKRTITH